MCLNQRSYMWNHLLPGEVKILELYGACQNKIQHWVSHRVYKLHGYSGWQEEWFSAPAVTIVYAAGILGPMGSQNLLHLCDRSSQVPPESGLHICTHPVTQSKGSLGFWATKSLASNQYPHSKQIDSCYQNAGWRHLVFHLSNIAQRVTVAAILNQCLTSHLLSTRV